ncbi:hypothetical protein ACH4UM_10460 [Streptomyces sp. NPDC020801]|uniref:hypothetical protein n=1 Tax=unclassified Streptomyces TaxID=2593676 RepID=UPI0037B632CB
MSEPEKSTPVRLVLNPGHTIEYPLFHPASRAVRGYCAMEPDLEPSIDVRPPHPARTDYGAGLHMTDVHGRRLHAVVCDTIRMGAPRLRWPRDPGCAIVAAATADHGRMDAAPGGMGERIASGDTA